MKYVRLHQSMSSTSQHIVDPSGLPESVKMDALFAAN